MRQSDKGDHLNLCTKFQSLQIAELNIRSAFLQGVLAVRSCSAFLQCVLENVTTREKCELRTPEVDQSINST